MKNNTKTNLKLTENTKILGFYSFNIDKTLKNELKCSYCGNNTFIIRVGKIYANTTIKMEIICKDCKWSVCWSDKYGFERVMVF